MTIKYNKTRKPIHDKASQELKKFLNENGWSKNRFAKECKSKGYEISYPTIMKFFKENEVPQNKSCETVFLFIDNFNAIKQNEKINVPAIKNQIQVNFRENEATSDLIDWLIKNNKIKSNDIIEFFTLNK